MYVENTTEINQSVLYLLCSFIAFKINKDKVKQIKSGSYWDTGTDSQDLESNLHRGDTC